MRLLAANGFTVRPARSVKEAVAAAAAEPFDVLVTDIGLPDGTGEDLLRQLRARGPIAGIAITGYGMEEDLTRFKDAGFDRHLLKPFAYPQLAAALAMV